MKLRFFDELHNLLLRFFMQRGLANNPAAADIAAFQFKLRFDQGQNHTVRSYQLERARQDQSQRDKRNVDHAKIDILRNMLARKKSRIHFFDYRYARIVSEFPRQLTMADIDRKNFRGATLQQTIRESAGRSANVERDFAAGNDSKVIERAAKFQRATTCELLRLRHGNWRVDLDQLRGLRKNVVPHPYFASHDRALRALAAFKKPALDQHLINSRLCLHHSAQTSKIEPCIAAIAPESCADVMQSGGINTITFPIGRVSSPLERAARQTFAARLVLGEIEGSTSSLCFNSIPAMKPHCRI